MVRLILLKNLSRKNKSFSLGLELKGKINIIKQAGRRVFKRPSFVMLSVSVMINVLFVYYLVLIQTTTWEVFWQSNIAIYNWLQMILSVLTAIGFGVVAAFMVYMIEKRQAQSGSWLTSGVSLLFSTAATGCTVCGAFLLPTLGIAASLTALPFGGLEVKFLSLVLIVYALYEYAKYITGVCEVKRKRWLRWEDGGLEIDMDKETVYALLKPMVILIGFGLVVYSLPKLPTEYKLQFQRKISVPVQQNAVDGGGGVVVNTDGLLAEVNPAYGYEINARYGNLGPQMIKAGIIDLEKFKSVYDRSGQPLTKEQLEILTKGSNKKIKIDTNNAYFLLNFFWAVGLGNRNRILTEGQITKYGKDQIGYFASTGGWTLAKGKAVDYLAKYRLIPLTAEQEKLVEQVSSNIYRPCCNNPTSFPDCNHGMALLGVLQLMAASGASEDQMYEAAKYFNAFWFPQSYYDLALYFRATKGLSFDQIDAKELLSKDYSSVSGWQRTKKLLAQKGLIKQAPRSGGGCGV